eukprot:Amastigsp_a678862_253.p1 type:complete len:227 gc:universal Amastigsp_a678862_253:785-105(-)
MALLVSALNMLLDKVVQPAKVDRAFGLAPIGLWFRCLDLELEQHVGDRAAVAVTVMGQLPRELDRRIDYVKNDTTVETKGGLGARIAYKRFVLGAMGAGLYVSPAFAVEAVNMNVTSVRSRREDSSAPAAFPSSTASRSLTWISGDVSLTAGIQVPIADGLSIDCFCGAYIDLFRAHVRDELGLATTQTAHEKDFKGAVAKSSWTREKLRAPFPFLRSGFYVCLDR